MGKQEILASLAFDLGPLHIGTTVLTTWLIMLLLAVTAWLATRRLRVDDPAPVQVAIEGAVTVIDDAIDAVMPGRSQLLLPFVGSLWIFVVIANLAGLIPGFSSPTGDLSLTTALAIMVFLSVHWFGIRSDGLAGYLRHYFRPNPLLFPFHILGEISRTVALAVRLFGNMMSLEMAALLVLLVAGLFAPVPLLMLHIVEALVQAYIFGMLALIYIAGGIQSQQIKKKEE